MIAKFTPAGALDTSFGSGGVIVRNAANGTNGELFRNIVVQSTGKIVVAGTIEHAGATDARDRDAAVMRFNADGTKDTTFGAIGAGGAGGGGGAGGSGGGTATDGLIVLDLSTGTPNGSGLSVDSGWGLAVYPDDRLVISGGRVRTGGADTDFVVIRLTAAGLRDATFGDNGLFSLDITATGDGGVYSNNASPRSVTILPGTDGIIGSGYQPIPGADTSPVVFKVKDNGTLDTTFGDQGVYKELVLPEQAEAYEAVVQPNASGSGYKLVTTGYGRELSNQTADILSLRINADGTRDTGYGTNGMVRIDVGGFADNSRRLLVLGDRRVMLLGSGRPTSSNADGLVAILTPDGQPDPTFSATGYKLYDLGGPSDFLWAGALSPDKKTVAVVGIKGVTASTSANDDAVLMLLKVAP